MVESSKQIDIIGYKMIDVGKLDVKCKSVLYLSTFLITMLCFISSHMTHTQINHVYTIWFANHPMLLKSPQSIDIDLVSQLL